MADTLNQVTRIYRCAKGHKIIVRGGTRVALHLEYTDPDATAPRVNREFNFCMECYGEWAEAQWPVKCEEVHG